MPLEATLRLALVEGLPVRAAGGDPLALLGYAADDFLQGRVALAARIHPDDADVAQALLAPTGPAQGAVNLRLRNAAGRICCVWAAYTRSSAGADGASVLDLRLQDARTLPRALEGADTPLSLRAMLEHCDDFVYFKDRHHVFTAASQSLTALCPGVTHWSEFVGQTDYDVFPEAYADRYYRLEKQIFAGAPAAREVQQTLDTKDLPGWVENRKYPIHDGAGALVGLFGIAHDVTGAMRLQQQLRDSEQRFRTLFENTPSVAVQGYDSQRRVIFWNAASAQLYGWTAAEALGRPLEDLIIPDAMREGVVEAVSAWVQGGPAIPASELTLRHKDGHAVDVFSSHVMLGGPDGPEMFCVDIDLTDRKRAEAELRRYRAHLEDLVGERTSELARAHARIRDDEERYAQAMAATDDGIWDLDVATGQSYVNPAYARMLGYEQAELGTSTGEHLMRLLHPDDRDRVEREVQRLLTRGDTFEAEFRMRCKDGSWKWVLSRGKAVGRDADGRPLRLVGTHIDLSARKRVETELRQAKEAAEAATVAKSAFLANMSHEIRTPMNAIIGMTSLLQRRATDPRQLESFATITSAAQHLLGIINDILDLSKIEAGRLDLEDLPLQVPTVVANMVSMLHSRARAKGLQLNCRVGPMPPGLSGDAGRLRQALVNFVTNAIKFTHAGSISVSADLAEEDDQGVLLRLEVADTGIGIAPEALPRLFSRFEQADNSTTRAYGGTGLGLVITKKIAEQMGGNVGVHSVPGQGSRFWMTARLRKTAPAVSAATAAGPSEVEKQLRLRHAGTTVLLAEDEPINAQITQLMLDEVGLSVELAEDGAQAVARAAGKAYGLILMDMQMPQLDGLEAARRIRALPGHARTPIVAMTANAFDEDRQRCLAAGMVDFLTKPALPETLYATLLRHLDAAT